MLTCAKLHVHEIIKEDGKAPRQEWVGHALSLQVLGVEGDLKTAQRAGPNSPLPRTDCPSTQMLASGLERNPKMTF